MAKKPTDPLKAIADAVIELTMEGGWRCVSHSEVADRAGLPLGEVYALFPFRGQLAGAVARLADREVMKIAQADEHDEEETPKDRLFDVLMTRFDVLQPYRKGLRQLSSDLMKDPVTSACLAPLLAHSMGLMLKAAGISEATVSASPSHCAKATILAGLQVKVMRVWFEDDSADMTRTMAALDKALSRAEEFANSWPFA